MAGHARTDNMAKLLLFVYLGMFKGANYVYNAHVKSLLQRCEASAADRVLPADSAPSPHAAARAGSMTSSTASSARPSPQRPRTTEPS
jgi:hypothetical protein